MDEIFSQICSPVFIVGTIIVGLVLNVLGTYIVRATDKIGSTVSLRWKNSSEKRKQKFQERAVELADNPLMEIMTIQTQILLSIFVNIFISILVLMFVASEAYLVRLSNIEPSQFVVVQGLVNLGQSIIFIGVMALVFWGLQKISYLTTLRQEVKKLRLEKTQQKTGS